MVTHEIITKDEFDIITDKYAIIGRAFKRLGALSWFLIKKAFNKNTYVYKKETKKENDEDEAAIKIQSAVKGHLVRNKKNETNSGWLW